MQPDLADVLLTEVRQLRGLVEAAVSRSPQRWVTLASAADLHEGVTADRLRQAVELRLLRAEYWPGRGGREIAHLSESEVRRIPHALRELARIESRRRAAG